MSIDLQNAYDLSRMEYRSECQREHITGLRQCGFWVVGRTIDIHCRFTDAVIATEDHVVSVHQDQEGAVWFREDDEWVIGPLPKDEPEHTFPGPHDPPF